MAFPTDGELEALRRCFTRASGVHPDRRVRQFLLAWHNANELGGFDIADLWDMPDDARADVMTVLKMIARGPTRWYPDKYGFCDEMNTLIAKHKAKAPGVAVPVAMPRAVFNCIEQSLASKTWRDECIKRCRSMVTHSQRQAVEDYVTARYAAAGAGYSGRWQVP